ncbi:hypothetical protein N752_16375 [Desulforamulus aquiferis]|nr:hypothetical protein [Desulforamulus aquiferis]RYD04153.1 hypothetical protein N752_16375 [Desulforamulus aquiferis]
MLELKRLWHLQILEEQREKSLNKRIDPKITKKLKELKTEIEQGQEKLKELKDLYEQAGQLQKHFSQEAQVIKDKISAVSEKIYGGSLQTKQIETYQQRHGDLRKKLLEIEDRELESMQQREDIKQQWEKQKATLANDTRSFKELHQEYLQGKEEIKERANDLPGKSKNL